MREIKFRAFIKSSKKIIDVEWIDFKNKQITYNSIDFGGFGIVDHSSFEDIELIEITGLKDKNGREIYEGDIVRILDDEETNEGWNEEVIFHRSCYMAGDENLLVNVYFRSEVIGNIYENPELLEGSSA